MTKDRAWKRMLGGLCGIGVVIALLLVLRQHGVSGAALQQWEEAIVMAVAAAAAVLWLVKR